MKMLLVVACALMFAVSCKLNLINSGSQVEPLHFNPVAGTYSSTQSVTISTDTTGAAIYYTTDGTLPTSSSTRYTGPLTVSTNTTITAIAMAKDLDNSQIGSASYVISSGPGADSITISSAPATLRQGTSAALIATTNPPGSAVSWSSDTPGVLTVDGSGAATASGVNVGRANVFATSPTTAATASTSIRVWGSQQLTAGAAFSARRYSQLVAFNGKMYLLGGDTVDGFDAPFEVWSSTDGIDWTQETVTVDSAEGMYAGYTHIPGTRHHAAAALNGVMVVVGGEDMTASAFSANNYVWVTSDGLHWDGYQGPFSGGDGYGLVTDGTNLYFVGVSSVGSPDVWKSTNGITWTSVSVSSPFPLTWQYRVKATYHANAIYIVTLPNSSSRIEMWKSTDQGVTWSFVHVFTSAEVPTSAAEVCLAEHDGALWLSNGLYDDVDGNGLVGYNELLVSEDDGVTWNPAFSDQDQVAAGSSSYQWDRRYGSAMVEYNGGLYMAAGSGGGTSQLNAFMNDVWFIH